MDVEPPNGFMQQALSGHRAKGIEPRVVAWDLYGGFGVVAFVDPVSLALCTELLEYSNQYERWLGRGGGEAGGGPGESPERYSRPSFEAIRLDMRGGMTVRDNCGHATYLHEACGFVGPSIRAVAVEFGEDKARVVPVRTDTGLFVTLSLGIQGRRLFAVDSEGVLIGDVITIPPPGVAPTQ